MPDYLPFDHPPSEDNDPHGCWGNACCFFYGIFAIATIAVIVLGLFGYRIF